MSKVSPQLSDLLPRDGTAWLLVSRGESGASVMHDPMGNRYVKIVTTLRADELAAERDRTAWLGSIGIPCPTVLDWHSSDRGAYLMTSAVPGVPADRLGPHSLERSWPSIVGIVRRLHEIPAAQCPYDRALNDMMSAARATVAEDRVHFEFLPAELQQTPPAAVLERLERELPQRLTQEQTAQVVCHGDLCLPNILIDPSTLCVTGLIDLGRLGRADPYADIALLLANARESWPDELTALQADRDFAQRYGSVLDPGRQRFYLRLDPLTW